MNSYSVVVAGCTRNSSSYIAHHLKKLYDLQNLFCDFRLIVYENDSCDSTVKELQEFQRHHSCFEFISERNIVPSRLDLNTRPQIIAHGRNRLLDHIATFYSHFDLMIMVDLDSVIAKFDTRQMKHVFDIDFDSWDALFANNVYKYYDIWALRISQQIWNPEIHGKLWKNTIPFDCWEMATIHGDARRYVYDYQVIIPVSTPLIPVDSAFGGFGIYKMDKIKFCRYNAIENGNVRCEHALFHRDMIQLNQARLFILPKLLMNEQREHVR
jgi:hypothetical protein